VAVVGSPTVGGGGSCGIGGLGHISPHIFLKKFRNAASGAGADAFKIRRFKPAFPEVLKQTRLGEQTMKAKP
jgi:hypothetical protein